MSHPFAIATVSATLEQLMMRVNDEPTLAGTSITLFPPHLARTNKQRQLNLFLYQIKPNAALRNQELPVRGPRGDLTRRPVLALNLHYLLTAYGFNDRETDAHRVISQALSLLHDNPMLTRDQIRAAVAANTSIAASDLADQFEMVKLTPEAISIEDLVKLWSAFQTSFRLSVAYEASVVLIERPHATGGAGLPVREAAIRVMPIRRPVIRAVRPQFVETGQRLTLEGRNLSAEVVKVRFGDQVADPDAVSDTEIVTPLPSGLRAGMHGVQVVHQLMLGDPPSPHRGFDSNAVAFVLVPRITTPAPITVARGATLKLNVAPAVGREQAVALLIGDRALAPTPHPPSAPPAASQVSFPISADLPTGAHLLRVRVDGAESPLVFSSTTNTYVGPAVTIT